MALGRLNRKGEKRSNYRRRKYRRTIAKEGLGDAKGDKGKEKTEKGK
jgi:hypothetical protein